MWGRRPARRGGLLLGRTRGGTALGDRQSAGPAADGDRDPWGALRGCVGDHGVLVLGGPLAVHDPTAADVARLGSAEATRVEAGEAVALAEELRPREQLHDRVREQEHDDDVDEGGQSEREGEAAHAADGEDVQHDRREEVHGVGRQDGPPGALPAALDGGDERAALTQLVPDAFEVHDERVRGDTDGDDQTRDTGQREPVALRPGQQGDDAVGEDAGDDEGRDGHQAERAVLEQRVEHDEAEADEAGEEALLQLLGPERGRDLLLALHLERQRQRAEVELVGQAGRGLAGEGAGDLGLAVRDDHAGVQARSRDHEAVEHDRELVQRRGAGQTLQTRRDLGELGGALRVERDVHDPLVRRGTGGGHSQARARARDAGALDLDRTKDVLRAAVLAARDEGLVRVTRGAAGEVGGVRAVEGVELRLDRGGDVVRRVARVVGRRLGGLVRRLLAAASGVGVGAGAAGSVPAADSVAAGVGSVSVGVGLPMASTGRNAICADRRTSSRVSSLGLPGSATTILPPLWLVISASATPEESTRCRMTSMA